MEPRNEHDLLNELAERCGIVPDYHDIWGQRHVTSDDTKRAILGAMGLRVDSTDSLRHALAEVVDAPWREACDPVQVIRVDGPGGLWAFRLPAQEQEAPRERYP